MVKKSSQKMVKRSKPRVFKSTSVLGDLMRISPDPPAVNKRPWHQTTLVINVDVGGGVIGNVQIAKLLATQERLASQEDLNISYRWIRVYTTGVSNTATLTTVPELDVNFSTLVPVASTGVSTSGPTLTSVVTGTDTGTLTSNAKLGFKFGELGRVPINGALGLAILDIKAATLPTLVHVHCVWNTAGYGVP